MKRTLLNTLAAGLIAFGVHATAQAQYTVGTITEALTVAEIETALTNASVSFTGTVNVEGIAFGDGNTVYIIHNDTTGNLTLAHIDLGTKAAVWTKTEAAIVSDLGLTGNLALVGELVYDTDVDRLYLASSIGWVNPGDPYTLFQVSTVAPYTASVILRDASIQGWNSHDVMPTGEIIGTLGEEYELITGNEPVVGVVDPSAGTPAFAPLFDADDFKAVVVPPLAPGEHLPPETIGVNPNNGTIYVFGHDNFELFGIPGLSALAPEQLSVVGWTDAATALVDRVDLHGISVDTNNNVWGFDEAAASIVVWDGDDSTLNVTGDILFSDIATAIGGATPPVFEATTWRGFKARATGATSHEVVIASATADYGVVLVEVTSGTSVADWTKFE